MDDVAVVQRSMGRPVAPVRFGDLYDAEKVAGNEGGILVGQQSLQIQYAPQQAHPDGAGALQRQVEQAGIPGSRRLEPIGAVEQQRGGEDPDVQFPVALE